MSAEDTVRRNKTAIVGTLCGDRMLILNKLHQNELITQREYNNLKSIEKVDVEGHVVGLVDKLINKGEDSCKAFLNLLQTDEDIIETYPKLKSMQWKDTSISTKPVQACSGDDSDVPPPESKRPKEVLAAFMSSTTPRDGMIGHGMGSADQRLECRLPLPVYYFAGTPVSAKPQPAPVSKKPKPAPVSKKPKPAPVSKKPKPAPVSKKPKRAPVSKKPKPAPVSKKPKPAPVSKKPKPAPVSKKPKPASVSKKPQRAPVSKKPQRAPVSKKPQRASVSKKPQRAPGTKKRR